MFVRCCTITVRQTMLHAMLHVSWLACQAAATNTYQSSSFGACINQGASKIIAFFGLSRSHGLTAPTSSLHQHSTAQHSTAQHSTAQHSTAQHSTAQHSTAQHSTAQHSTAQHSAAQRMTPALQTTGFVCRQEKELLKAAAEPGVT